MKNGLGMTAFLGVVIALGATAPAAAQPAAAPARPEEFSGQIVNPRGGSWKLRLRVHEYTPNEELDALVRARSEQGLGALLEVVARMPVRGWVRIGDAVGCPVAVVRSQPTDTGRRIVAVTDSPIQFVEFRRGLRLEEYPLGMIVLELDGEGGGEGRLLGAAQASFEPGRVGVESYGPEPLQVIRVKTEKPAR